MVTRRQFLKIGMGGTALLFFGSQSGSGEAIAAVIPGGTIDTVSITKYVMPLVVPPAMPRTRVLSGRGIPGQIDYYEVAVRQLEQRILPPDMPLTTVWGYCSLVNPKRTFDNAGAVDAANIDAAGVPGTLNYPSFTIEARAGRAVRVKWINQLRADPNDPASPFLPHLLSVDPTLHWANPPRGTDPERFGSGPIDSEPEYTVPGGLGHTPQLYDGPVPFVTHVHGALDVGDESDGYSEAWYLPQAGNIPAGYAVEGSWYKTFRQKYWDKFRDSWEPGSATFHYSNTQRATTLWYHDHVLGMTRLNVYAGPAGFYIVRGGPGDQVINTRTLGRAVLPSGAYEIPIVVQDRSFNSDGSLFFPSGREFFDGYNGPFIPESDMHPFHNPEFFGNTMVVNGRTWPTHQVEARRYRFRFLNGCNSRFLALKLVAEADYAALGAADPEAAAATAATAATVPVWQIGNEGGFLRAPVDIGAANGGTLLIAPAERADVIMDFTGLPVGTRVYLTNEGPDEPFGGGVAGVDFPISDYATTRQVMLFEVVAPTSRDNSTPPAFLGLPAITALGTPSNTRQVALIEVDSATTMVPDPDNPGLFIPAGPRAAYCGVVAEPGPTNTFTLPTGMEMEWADPITENPAVGAVEDWEIYNFTMDAHPIHVHEVAFEVVGRQAFTMEGMSVVGVDPQVRPPEPWEDGVKDTVIAYPGEVTRIRARFDRAGRYVWHCHIVDHEDNEMMRPYDIGALNNRGQMHTGRIRIDHRESEAVFTYVYVGDALVTTEKIAPASGLDLIAGTKLTIDAINSLGTGAAQSLTAVGGGEGYGVNTMQRGIDRKLIEGPEQLAFSLNKPAANGLNDEQTYMLDMVCAFRMATLGGSATVVVEAFKDGVSLAGPQTLAVTAAAGSLFTTSYTIAFGAPGARLPFDKIVFSAAPGSKYSIVRAIEIRTLTAVFNSATGLVGLAVMGGEGAQARQIFVCDL